jgi:hypothetical protein
MDMEETAHAILSELRACVEASGEGSLYGNRAEALQDIDALLAHQEAGQVKLLLAPTANLQELSIECGWGGKFNKLAAQLEQVLCIK